MYKLINGAKQRYNRATLPGVQFSRDFDDLINQYDLSKLIGQSRAIYNNNPLVKNAIDSKASYSIGNAFQYRCQSVDSIAKGILDNAIKQWSKIAEVSGKNLNDVLWLTSTLIDVDGDCYWLLSQANGYPQIQLIEAHSVGSHESGKIDRGTEWEEKGVFYNKKTKRPTKYRVLGADEKSDKIISTRDMIRISEPSMSVRGTPLVSAAMRIINDIDHSQELLLTQHLMATVMSIVEHNENGEPSMPDLTDTDSSGSPISVETINQDGGKFAITKPDKVNWNSLLIKIRRFLGSNIKSSLPT